MSTESILALGVILAAFAFFATALTYADMTWDRPARKVPAEKK